LEYKEPDLVPHKNIFWEKAIGTTICFLIILVPLVFYPWCMDIFRPVKELVAEILGLVCLMFWGFKLVDKRSCRFAHTFLDIPLFSFILIGVISLFWSDSLLVSLRALPLFLVGPILYFIVVNNIQNEFQINKILNLSILMGSILGLYGIFQYLGIDFSIWRNNVGRAIITGLFGNVNYFAEYLITLLPLAISLFLVTSVKSKKILLLVGILAMGGSLILTFTRSSYLGFGVSLVFMFLLFVLLKGKAFIKENKKIFILILIGVILTTFLFIIPNPLNEPGTTISKIKARTSITELKEGYSVRRRMITWKFTWMMITDRPILGSGIGSFKYNSLRYQAEFLSQGENYSLYPFGIANEAHNEYLHFWAELGFIGLGIFLCLISSYFYYGWKLLKKIKDDYKRGMVIGLMSSVLAVLVDGIFGFPFHLSAVLIMFWLFFGITVVIGLKEKQSNEGLEKRRIENSTKVSPGRISHYRIILFVLIIFLTLFLSIDLIRPFMARVNWHYGYIEVKKKNWDEALNIFQKALKWDPYFGQMSFNIGEVLLKKGLYEEAGEYFKIAEKTCDLPSLPFYLGIVYNSQDDLEMAAKKFKQAIFYQKNEEEMVPIYINLGTTYFRLKENDLAENCYQNALKIEPNVIQAHFGMGLVYVEKKLWQKAVEEFLIVIELNPDSETAKKAKELIQQITQK
jgi:O-antigen ligase/Tfp pilus assembly protein PilF